MQQIGLTNMHQLSSITFKISIEFSYKLFVMSYRRRLENQARPEILWREASFGQFY